jgi:Holliday junction resolvasome RuvABC endonuclease subunit
MSVILNEVDAIRVTFEQAICIKLSRTVSIGCILRLHHYHLLVFSSVCIRIKAQFPFVRRYDSVLRGMHSMMKVMSCDPANAEQVYCVERLRQANHL